MVAPCALGLLAVEPYPLVWYIEMPIGRYRCGTLDKILRILHERGMRSTRMSPGIRSNRTSRLAQLLFILALILLPEAKHPHKPTDPATTVLRMALLHLLSISADSGFLSGSAMPTTAMRSHVRLVLPSPPNLNS